MYREGGREGEFFLFLGGGKGVICGLGGGGEYVLCR